MKIEKIYPCSGETIETDTGEFIRYSSDNWSQFYGDSLEPLWFCEELEEAYQRYIKEQK